MIESLGGATVDMDQIQVHPTVVQDTGMLVSETVRGEGAILVNHKVNVFYNELKPATMFLRRLPLFQKAMLT